MFWTVPLSTIRSFPLYTQWWYMSYRFADSLRAGSGWNCKPVWRIPLLCVHWKTPDEGQRNYLKHVEFHSKNKFEKLLHLVGFIIRNLSRCTVTWMSKEMFLTEVVEENEIYILHPVHLFVFGFRDHSTKVCLTVRSFPNLRAAEQSAVVIAYRTPPPMGETKESIDWVRNIIKARLFYLLT